MSVQTVGRYEIIGELGRGAMGVVYKAQDPAIGRTVALKTMRLDVHGLETDDVLRRFKNEARAAGLLNHPNIVTIYDAGEQDGVLYIAMEFIEGTTLQFLLAEKRVLTADETIHISRQICKGLDYAHANGTIHRDIKPANIMITADGTAKIMDFGIAKAGGGMTSTGQVFGTPNYMSPEQVKGKELDGRSDLFSFGVVLYEMVTGEKPFAGQNVTTIIYKIVNDNPIAPRDLDVTVPPGLSMVVSKSLAKNPDHRYQTGAELTKDLENCKSAGANLSAAAVLPGSTLNLNQATQPLTPPVQAARTTTTGVHPAAPASGRRGITVLLVACVLLALAVGGYLLYLYRATRKMQEADRALEEKISEQQRTQAANASALRATEGKSQDTAPTSTLQPPPKAADSAAASSNNQDEFRFDSQPRGAKVTVDGRTESAWLTPFPVSNLDPGKHTIVFTKAGYISQSRSITVTEGKGQTVFSELAPAVSRLVITSTPMGATIEIDGRDTGKITPAEIAVAKGAHTIMLRKSGYSDMSLTETVGEGQTANFSPVLSQPPTDMSQSNRIGLFRKIFGGSDSIPQGKGQVRIHTVPEGAAIQVNGRLAPKKTNVVWPVDPGTYDIVLTMDGYKPVHRTVRVERGKEIPVDEILEKR